MLFLFTHNKLNMITIRDLRLSLQWRIKSSSRLWCLHL